MRWLILISAAASLLTQAGLWWVVLRGRPRGAPTPGARALSAAVLLGPLLIAALLVIAVHLGRLGVFELMIAPASVKQAYLAGTCEGLCAVGSPRVFAGVALLAMGGLSLIAAAIAWQRRRIADLGELSFAACLGIGLLSGVLGLSALLLDLRLARIQALYDQEESDLLLAALKDFSHPWWIEAAIGLVLLMAFTVLVSRICKLDPGRRPGGHALVGSIAVLALGVAAFCVTRLHARDLDRGIDVMAGAKGPDGRLRVPAALRSAVYGGLRAREQLDVENEVKLPLSGSEGFVVRDPCVRISGSLEAVKLEGVQVAALGKGLLDEQAHGLDVLREVLDRYRLLEAAGDRPPTGEEGVCDLCLDRRLPFETLDRIVQAASRAGFPFFRLAVLQREARPLQRCKIGQLSFAAPAVCLGASQESRPRTSVEPWDLASVLAREVGRRSGQRRPDGALDLDRLSRVSIDDLNLPGDERASERVHWLRIDPAGFQLGTFSMPDAEPGPAQVAIPKKGGQYDYKALNQEAADLKRRFPDSERIVIQASRGVTVAEIVRCLDSTREQTTDQELDTKRILFTCPCVGIPLGKAS